MSSIQSIPQEVLKIIIFNLPLNDIESCSRVCKKWNQLFLQWIPEIKKNPVYLTAFYQRHFSHQKELDSSTYRNMRRLFEKKQPEELNWQAYVNDKKLAEDIRSSSSPIFGKDESNFYVVTAFPRLILTHIALQTKKIIKEIPLHGSHDYSVFKGAIHNGKIFGILQYSTEKRYHYYADFNLWNLNDGKLIWTKQKVEGIYINFKKHNMFEGLNAVIVTSSEPKSLSILNIANGEEICTFSNFPQEKEFFTTILDRSLLVEDVKEQRYAHIGRLSKKEEERLQSIQTASFCESIILFFKELWNWIKKCLLYS